MEPDFEESELDQDSRLYGRKMMWFVILWCAGFIVTLMLSLPFKILVNVAMR